MGKRVDLNQKPDNSNFRNRKNTHPTMQRYNSTSDNNLTDEEMNYNEGENVASVSNTQSNRSNTNIGSNFFNKLAGLNSSKKLFKNASGNEKFKILMKNPFTRKIILIIGLIAIVLLFLIYIIMVITGEDGEDSNIGLYNYYANTCSKVKYGDDIIDFEEYITTVIAGEVTSRSDETLKAFAVAARTYLLHKTEKNKVDISDNECYYDATSIRQAYRPDKVNDRHRNAVKETEGLIITLNGNVAGGHFDEACVYNASQASAADPSNNYSDDNYYIQYGRDDVGGLNFQTIPKSDLDKFRNHIEDYANTGTPCYKNHGMGMSQSGSEYLSVIKNYTWEEIIDFYYKGQEEIMTTTEHYGSYGDGTIFRQGDPAWGNISLGTSSTNMAWSGCAVTSIAIGISFSGASINAPTFNAGVFINALNSGNCFTPTGGIKWGCSAISKIAPSVKYISSSHIGGDNNNKINYINSYPLNKYIIITHFQNSAHARGHYVNFQEFINNEEYLARDPSPGEITTQKISEIDQIVIYSY